MSLPKIEHPLTDLIIPSINKRVKVRPLLVKEEKILLHAKTTGEYGDMLMAIRQVVNNCIVDKEFSIDKLALFDLEYLFLRLRAISVNNIAKVSYKDNETDDIHDFDINLDEVTVKMPDLIDMTIRISEELVLIMKYPEAGLWTEKEYTSPDQDIDYLITKTIDKVVEGDKITVFGNESKEDVTRFVESLPVGVYEEIKKFWDNIPTLFYEIKYKNKKGTERSIVLRTLEDFFILR